MNWVGRNPPNPLRNSYTALNFRLTRAAINCLRLSNFFMLFMQLFYCIIMTCILLFMGILVT